MRFLTYKYVFSALILSGFFSTKANAQNSVSVQQDSRFEELLNEKRKINASITVNDRYKIQIFYGTSDKARKALQDFKREFKTTDGTIVFESPNYKVWVGSYKSKIEAEKSLVDFRKKYPTALIIKPNK
ncbi:SPOR domain-containing protein [Flavobacterium sp. RHBU_3]|uniref:SPOR domain-containing protein n=1 Tax=Flavobacterium sp. RHBU_3 TaxID=3391184 RepID=UPI003984C3FC